ncbi:TIGR03749 family integrating conjugative element protein [Vibrio sp. TBV020]|uniref:TIGR03749 family integrating conjugative element protein n=1 Tax=Vibrio sp. TBV020 TaxID=3137398 RepID=UPI0038CD7EA5
MFRFLLAVLLMLHAMSVSAVTPRALEWQGSPLAITLTPGQETTLRFSDDVRVATPAYLSSALSVTSLAGQVYLTAHAPFDVSRLHVERLHDGMRLLLDVNAKEEVMTPPRIDIVWAKQNRGEPNVTEQAPSEAHFQALKMAPEALLVRYAMQSLYSPSFAIEPLPGVTRAPMGLPHDIADSAFPKWRVQAKPLAAWQLGGKVVTAVKLTNLQPTKQTLDPRGVTLAGRCLLDACQVSFSHSELGAQGVEQDNATAFIVTPGALASHLLLGGRHD